MIKIRTHLIQKSFWVFYYCSVASFRNFIKKFVKEWREKPGVNK